MKAWQVITHFGTSRTYRRLRELQATEGNVASMRAFFSTIQRPASVRLLRFRELLAAAPAVGAA